jgi:hypothetical protein
MKGSDKKLRRSILTWWNGSCEVARMLDWAHTQPMKPPVPADPVNDNGKPEDHLAAATAALHKVMEGLDAPAALLVDALVVKPPVGATQP